MALNIKLWTKLANNNAYPNSAWTSLIKHNWDSKAGADQILVPQIDPTSGGVVDGRTAVLPLGVNNLTITEQALPLHVFLHQPTAYTLIDFLQAQNTSDMNAMSDLSEIVFGSMSEAIQSTISVDLSVGETSLASIVRTSGTARTNDYGKAAMKACTYDDWLEGSKIFKKYAKGGADKYALVPPTFLKDLKKFGEQWTALGGDYAKNAIIDGVVGMLDGFKVIEVPFGIPYIDNATVPNNVTVYDFEDGYDNTHFSSILMFDANAVGLGKTSSIPGTPIRLGVDEYATGQYRDIIQADARARAGKLYLEATGSAGELFQRGIVQIIESV